MCTWIGRNSKETVLWGTITWSESKKEKKNKALKTLSSFHKIKEFHFPDMERHGI